MGEYRPLSIRFFLDGRPYAGRSNWSVVPRVGDEVMLYMPKSEEKACFIVKRVVFGVEAEQGLDSRFQCINIEIDRPTDKERGDG